MSRSLREVAATSVARPQQVSVATRVALYARVSTTDKDQDPELQLVPLRAFARAQGWAAVEYVDWASGADIAARKSWQELRQAVSRKEVQTVLVWKLDRAFRSTLHALTTLEEWSRLGVSFRCLTQADVDLTSATGRLVFTILAAVAEMERSLISERVREGMALAARKGSLIGRPPVTRSAHFRNEWLAVKRGLEAGTLSRRAAADRLGVGVSTLGRLLASGWSP